MYAPPRNLAGSDLAELVHALGGPASARKVLDVSERTLRRWLADGSCPLGFLRLAWYASPYGREAAEVDIGNELRLVAAQRDCALASLARRLPLDIVPSEYADAANAAVFAQPATQRSALPSWHPASKRHKHTEESA
jgi:hypothetical protein